MVTYLSEDPLLASLESGVKLICDTDLKGGTLFVRTLNLRVAQVFLFSLCPASANNTDIFQGRKYT